MLFSCNNIHVPYFYLYEYNLMVDLYVFICGFVYIYLKINMIDVESTVATVSTRHNCYVYELYVSPGKRHCSRIRAFNGEHLSRGWPVFLIVRMSFKWAGIMATICDGGVYTAPWYVKEKKRKRGIKSRARYHTLSTRFLPDRAVTKDCITGC